MTRIVGSRRTITPCCQREYLETAFASINFSASEYWTDGHREASLAPTDGGVRLCACGHLYTTSEATYLPGVVRSESIELPRGQRVSDLDLEQAVSSCQASLAAEISLRRRFWRVGNEAYRASYREIKRMEKNAFPRYELSVRARENLLRLTELLSADHIRNAIELSEIYRAVGRPEKSVERLSREFADESEARMANLMRRLIDLDVRGPVRYQP